MEDEETDEKQKGSQGTQVSNDTSSEKENGAVEKPENDAEADEIPELAPVAEEKTKDEKKEDAEPSDGDDYKMPTLKEVEEKEEAKPNETKGKKEEDTSGKTTEDAKVEEEDHIDLDSTDIEEHTSCPKCSKDYVGSEKFCTNCGAQVVRTQVNVQVKEEIPKIKAEAVKDGVYKAPALEWHEDEPKTFEVACYNCENVFDATVAKVPAIINCTQCNAQLQIEELPPDDDDEDDEEDLELTPKQPSIPKVKPPKKGCPTCGGKTRFIPRHFKWFCDTCRVWI